MGGSASKVAFLVIRLGQSEPPIFGNYMQQENTIKYFAYMRKSSDDSAEKQTASLETQKLELDQMIERGGLTVLESFREAKTAKQPGREVFNAMMDRIEKGEANGILAWKLDRLARNPVDAGRVQWLLQTGKIQLIKTYERDYTPKDHSIVASVEMSMATQYSRDLKTMAYRSIRAKLAKGQPPQPAPVGYLNDTSKPEGDRGWIPDPDRFGLVREMWSMLLSRTHMPSEIQRTITERGLTFRKTAKQGGGPLKMTTVYKIFHDPAYCGEFLYIDPDTQERKLWSGSYEPMVSRAEFDEAQQILGQKGRPHPIKYPTAYSGLIRCEDPACRSAIVADIKNQMICSNCKNKFDCDAYRLSCPKCGTMIVEMTNKPLHYHYLRCSRRRNPACTNRRYVKLAELEEQIDQELREMDIDAGHLKIALDYINNQTDEEYKTHDDGRKLIQQAINDCNAQLKQASDEYSSVHNLDHSIYTPEEYKQKKTEILSNRAKLEVQMSSKQGKQDRTIELSEKTFNFCAYAHHHFTHGDIQKRRAILTSIGEDVTLRDKKLHIGAYEPFIIIKNTIAEIKAQRNMLGTKNHSTVATKNSSEQELQQKWLGW